MKESSKIDKLIDYLVIYDGANFGDILLKCTVILMLLKDEKNSNYLRKTLCKPKFKNLDSQNIRRNYLPCFDFIININNIKSYNGKIKILNKEITILNKKKILLSIINLVKSKNIYFVGGIFQDKSSIKSFIFYFFLLFLAIILRKKIFFLCSTIDIKSNILTKLFFLSLLYAAKTKLIQIIELRDKLSLNILNKIDAPKRLIKDPLDFRLKKIRWNIIKINEFYNLNNSIDKIEKYKFKTDINKNKNKQKKMKNSNKIFMISINKSYNKSKKSKILIDNIRNFHENGYKIIFIISDYSDYLYIKNLVKYIDFSYHVIRIHPGSILGLIKLIKKSDLKVLYTQRLHVFLVLKKYFDYIFTDETKVLNYINTWYN